MMKNYTGYCGLFQLRSQMLLVHLGRISFVNLKSLKHVVIPCELLWPQFLSEPPLTIKKRGEFIGRSGGDGLSSNEGSTHLSWGIK